MVPSVVVPPLDEKDAGVGMGVPNLGVFVYKTAPTVMAPTAFACPTIVPALAFTSSIFPSPLKIMYLNFTLGPDALEMIIPVTVDSLTVKGSTSIGSPPILFRLNPNNVGPPGVPNHISISVFAPVLPPNE